MIAQPGDSGKEDSALHASQSRQVVTNTFTAWAGTAVNGIVGFLLVPFLLMRLGKDGYGLASLIGSVIGLTALADLGLRGALSRHLAEHVARRDEKSFNETLSSAMLVYLLIGGTLTLACFFCETPVAQWFRISSDSLAAGRTLIRWYAAPMILFGFLSPLFSGTIVALARLDVLNTLGFLVAVTRGAGLVFALGPMNGGLFGWAVVTFASTLLSLFATAWMAHRLWPSLRLALRFVRFDALRPLFSLGGYLFTLQITMVASMQSDPIVIGRYLGTGAVALYNPGLSLVSVLRPLITALADQLSPFATYYHVQGQQERLQQLLIRGTRYTFLLGILTFSCVGVFSDPIMKVWLHGSLGSDYAVAAQVLFLWSLVDLGTYTMGTQWVVMLASKRLALATGLAVILATLNICASIYLVSSTKLGVIGVVVPTVVQRLITLAILAPYSAKLCGLTASRYFIASYLRPLTVGSAVGACAFGLREYLHPSTFGALALCVLAVFALWCLLSWNIGLSGIDRSAFKFHFRRLSGEKPLAKIPALAFILSLWTRAPLFTYSSRRNTATATGELDRTETRRRATCQMKTTLGFATQWFKARGDSKRAGSDHAELGERETPGLDTEGIFIVGCHRSGTTLLRYVLDSHPFLACPPESKFIAGLQTFLEYPQAMEGMHSLGLNDRQILALLRHLVQDALMHYARQHSKPRWIDKTPNYSAILPFIDGLFEGRARYIIMLRHPFDSARSLYKAFKHLTVDNQDPDLAAVIRRYGNDLAAWLHYWREINERLLAFSARNADRCLLLKYEDLIHAPEEHVSRILDFIAVERLSGDAARMCSKALKIQHSDGYQDKNILSTRRIHDHSINTWTDWPPEEVAAGWAVVGETASALGYHCNEAVTA